MSSILEDLWQRVSELEKEVRDWRTKHTNLHRCNLEALKALQEQIDMLKNGQTKA